MTKRKQARRNGVRSLDAWEKQYIPRTAAAEQEAAAPFKEVIDARAVEILVERAAQTDRPARTAPREFRSIEAWEAHYLPGLTEARREAMAPLQDIIAQRTLDILAS